MLHKVLWIAKILGDKITASQFCVKVNFPACTVALDEFEKSLKKNYENSKIIRTQQPQVNVLSKKTDGEDFCCSARNKTSFVKLLSQYVKDRNTIANSKDNDDTHIGGPTSDFACEKNFTVNAEGKDIFVLFCTY